MTYYLLEGTIDWYSGIAQIGHSLKQRRNVR